MPTPAPNPIEQPESHATDAKELSAGHGSEASSGTCRSAQCFLVVTFLLAVASPVLIQTAAELIRAQPVGALDVFHQKPTRANLRAYEDNLESASLVAQAFRPLFQYAQFNWLQDGGEKALVGREGWLFYRPGYTDMLAAPARPATNDAVAAIVAWRDALAGRGIHLLVVPVPNKESIYPDRLTRRVGAGRSVLAPGTQDLFHRLRDAGVEYVDLYHLFTGIRSRSGMTLDTPLYLAHDSHWAPAGLEQAAKTVARTLVEKRWIERGTVEYREAPASIKRLGDIVRMLQAPQIERHAVPETIRCAQVIRDDNAQLYSDDPQSEILVLGDSFLRIFQSDEPGSAGFIAHLAKELRQPVASIVNDGGAATLVRQELYRRPALLKNKRVVIWEFVERDLRNGTDGWQHVPLP